jgi:hypothetical protein
MEMSEASMIELSRLLQSLNERIAVKDSKNASVQELEREAERHFSAMHDSFKRVLQYGKSDVFVRYLMEQLESFAVICADAANKGALRVTEHQFQNAQLLLSAFGDSKRVVRYTWKISPGQRLFEDEAWRKYFELSSSLAISGAMEIRAMLIVEDRRGCDAINLQKLLEFFASQENLTAKIVPSAVWDTCSVDHAIPSNCVEFGIFGTNLLYEANAYTPVSVGRWYKDPVEIARYTRFFDAIWSDQSLADSNQSSPKQKVKLSEVMATDSTIDRRQSSAANPVHDILARIEKGSKTEVA